jgi:hypothetical protein
MRFELTDFNRDVPDESLLADLKSAHEKLKALGRSLTFRSYADVGKYHASTINVRFGSWNDALRRAGLEPKDEKNISIVALFDNLKTVWIAKGRQPVYREMSSPPSQYTGSTYAARFGGWRNALKAFIAAFDEEEYASSVAESRVTSAKVVGSNRDPSLALRFRVLKRDCFRCVACGKSPSAIPGLVLEVDHITPWSKGGATVLANLQTLCFDCNRGKSAD